MAQRGRNGKGRRREGVNWHILTQRLACTPKWCVCVLYEYYLVDEFMTSVTDKIVDETGGTTVIQPNGEKIFQEKKSKKRHSKLSS